jgi:hypothetical protein
MVAVEIPELEVILTSQCRVLEFCELIYLKNYATYVNVLPPSLLLKLFYQDFQTCSFGHYK